MYYRRVLQGVFLTVLMLSSYSCGNDGTSPGQAGVAGEPDRGLLVTFDAKGDPFLAQVTRDDSIQAALRWVETGEQPTTVAGTVDEGTSVNDPYSWHLRPDSVTFGAQVDVEPNCSTRPMTFQAEGFWRDCVIYAPDDARITEVHDCRGGDCVVLSPAPTGTPTSTATPTPTSTSSPAPSPTGSYDPCAGKVCGASCTVCDPADPSCVETAVVKSCDAGGSCVTGQVSCG